MNKGDVGRVRLGDGDPEKRARELAEWQGAMPEGLAVRLVRNFQYHTVTVEEARKMAMLREELLDFSGLMAGMVGYECPELHKAITYLESAMLWANAAIARRGR